MFKNSARTAKKKLYHYKDNLLMLFKEIIAVHSENYTKPIRTK
jgi:hypothetical protein